MATRTTLNISDDVKAVLRRVEVEGDELTLPGSLDRKLYVAVNKVLEILGFKWNRGRGAHVLPPGKGDAKSIVNGALGKALEEGKIVDPVKATQFYPTPRLVIDQMLDVVELTGGVRVLEPSAGDGAIIRATRDRFGRVEFDVCEIDPERAKALAAMTGVTVVGTDFLRYTEYPAAGYRAILMNPPFANGQAVAHVRHALKMLAPGGPRPARLVAVMPSSFRSSEDRATRALKDELDRFDTEVADLPDGAFKASGTMVRAVLLSVRA